MKSLSANQSPKNSYQLIGVAPPERYSTEWFLCNYFEEWKPQTLQKAIEDNFMWDMSEWTSKIVDHIIDQYLSWAKRFRPDLHKIASTFEGRRWLKNNIHNAMKTMK